jgi:hypothetical protein
MSLRLRHYFLKRRNAYTSKTHTHINRERERERERWRGREGKTCLLQWQPFYISIDTKPSEKTMYKLDLSSYSHCIFILVVSSSSIFWNQIITNYNPSRFCISTATTTRAHVCLLAIETRSVNKLT